MEYTESDEFELEKHAKYKAIALRERIKLTIKKSMKELLEDEIINCKHTHSDEKEDNNEEFNVVQYACAHGSVEMLKWILQSSRVYVYKFDIESSSSYQIYDVTGLVPDTLAGGEDGKHEDDQESCDKIIVRNSPAGADERC